MASRSMSAANESSSPVVAVHLEPRDRVRLEDSVARTNVDPLDDAGDVGGDDVLHLHRFHHEQLLTTPDTIPGRDIDVTIVPCIGARTTVAPSGSSSAAAGCAGRSVLLP